MNKKKCSRRSNLIMTGVQELRAKAPEDIRREDNQTVKDIQ